MQWHPIFARLLRAILEAHYEVRTTVPVGDLPREADIVVLHRSSTGATPFQGLWRWLTTWNVVEFKGVNASARVSDLDSLVEVGLGVHRRLNEQAVKEDNPEVEREGMSWWYIVPHLGRRFRRDAETLLGQTLEELAPGIWRVRHLERTLMLVSGDTVALDRDSLPMHVLIGVPKESRPTAAAILGNDASLLTAFSGWLSINEPVIWQEIVKMAAERGEMVTPDLQPLFDYLGVGEVLRQIGPKRVVSELGAKQVVSELGAKQVLSEVGVDGILSEMPPDQIEELIRRYQQTHQAKP